MSETKWIWTQLSFDNILRATERSRLGNPSTNKRWGFQRDVFTEIKINHCLPELFTIFSPKRSQEKCPATVFHSNNLVGVKPQFFESTAGKVEIQFFTNNPLFNADIEVMVQLDWLHSLIWKFRFASNQLEAENISHSWAQKSIFPLTRGKRIYYGNATSYMAWKMLGMKAQNFFIALLPESHPEKSSS